MISIVKVSVLCLCFSFLSCSLLSSKHHKTSNRIPQSSEQSSLRGGTSGKTCHQNDCYHLLDGDLYSVRAGGRLSRRINEGPSNIQEFLLIGGKPVFLTEVGRVWALEKDLQNKKGVVIPGMSWVRLNWGVGPIQKIYTDGSSLFLITSPTKGFSHRVRGGLGSVKRFAGMTNRPTPYNELKVPGGLLVRENFAHDKVPALPPSFSSGSSVHYVENFFGIYHNEEIEGRSIEGLAEAGNGEIVIVLDDGSEIPY